MSGLEHEEWCQAQPGEDGPRLERFRYPLSDDRGRPRGSVAVERCIECNSTTYDGERRG